MKIKCAFSECLYEWDYNGENPFYATCPRCLRKVKVPKEETEQIEEIKEE